MNKKKKLIGLKKKFPDNSQHQIYSHTFWGRIIQTMQVTLRTLAFGFGVKTNAT